MKIIELLNKIANNEEVPEEIKYNGSQFKYLEEEKVYINKYEESLGEILILDKILNDEVEIIEDEEEIDIQKIELAGLNSFVNLDEKIDNVNLVYKYNELLLAVKQLDKNIKELNK